MGTSLGRRIKTLRQKRKLTLAEISELANLSASHLSQVERDKATPSLTTLNSIAQALGVSLRDLFESEADQVYLTRASDGAEDGAETLPLVSARLTAPQGGWKLEVDRLTIRPGTPYMEFEPQRGEVMGFVLEGTLKLVIDGEEFQLGAGDSIHYDANRPYQLSCAADSPCTVIWCHSPPRYDVVAGQGVD
jgi:transcriptional regulator with XRE-family HTH domain